MSNLSDIGFPIRTEEDVNQIIIDILPFAEKVPCKGGFYLRFADESGAQIYLQGNAMQDMIGFNPHFSGTSRIKVNIAEKLQRDSSELDGGYVAESGSIGRFVFDVPDFLASEKENGEAEIQLTAFASNDLQATENDSPDEFFPAGMFQPSDSEILIENDIKRPIARICGEITSIEKRRNSLTKTDFYHLKLKTVIGEVDVAADEKLISDSVSVGARIKGHFWLSALFV